MVPLPRVQASEKSLEELKNLSDSSEANIGAGTIDIDDIDELDHHEPGLELT